MDNRDTITIIHKSNNGRLTITEKIDNIHKKYKALMSHNVIKIGHSREDNMIVLYVVE